MTASTTLTITTAGLPAAELKGLLEPLAAEDGVQVEIAGGETRHLDPQLTVGILDFAGTLALPFVIKLAERLFKRAPKAALRGKDAGGSDIEITANDDPPAREVKLTLIVDHPNPQLTIHVS